MLPESVLPSFGTPSLLNQQVKTSSAGFLSVAQEKRVFEVSITVQASGGSRDTAMCHRFVNFETSDRSFSESTVHSQVQEYLRVLKQNEGSNALVFSKVNYEQSHSGERQWTVCIVFDPK